MGSETTGMMAEDRFILALCAGNSRWAKMTEDQRNVWLANTAHGMRVEGEGRFIDAAVVAIRAAEAAAYERAAEWCDGREEWARKETRAFDEYHPGLSDAYAAAADWLSAEAARVRGE